MKTPSVHELRKQGARVRVVHMREYAIEFSKRYLSSKRDQEAFMASEFTKLEMPKPVCLPRGGKTIVDITLANGVELHGEANCAKNDMFCRRVGLTIAIGKAIRGNKEVKV